MTAYLFVNSLTTIATVYFYNVAYNYYTKNQKDLLEQKVDYLYKKVHELEMSLNYLQQFMEDIDDHINTKNNQVIQSSIALNSKLDEFINYNYDIN